MRYVWLGFLLLCNGFALGSPPADNHEHEPTVGAGMEIGMNSLASIAGLTATYYAAPQLAIDAGGGFGISNWRFGLGVRCFFLERYQIHPYIGAAYEHAAGWGQDDLSMSLNVKRNGLNHHYDFQMAVDPTNFANLIGGIEIRFGHFLLRPGIGYSQQLGGRNWRDLSGTGPVGEDKLAMDLLEGSGPTAFVGIGFIL